MNKIYDMKTIACIFVLLTKQLQDIGITISGNSGGGVNIPLTGDLNGEF